MASVIRMTDRLAKLKTKHAARGRRRLEQRLRYPGPDALESISCRPLPPRLAAVIAYPTPRRAN
jgi:hypothetical protein